MTRINPLTGKEIVTCVICKGDIEHKTDPATGRVYWTEGHNAQPVADGRCCDVCNATAVMTARLSHIFGERAASVANAIASTPKPTPCTAFRKGDDPRYECTCAKCRAVFEEGDEE